MNSLQLSQEERKKLRASYLSDGYIFFKGFLSKDEIGKVTRVTEELIANRIDQLPQHQVYYEEKGNKSTIKQIQKLFEYDDTFEQMMFQSRFSELAELLLGEKEVPKNMQYFNKPPRIGQPTPPHQDGYYFMLEPQIALTMWLALDYVDEKNGCVRYVKGSHKQGMRPHGRTQVLGFSQGMLDFGTANDKENEVFFSAEPGDLLVHDALTVHWADANQSETRNRRSLGFIYYGESAKVDEEAHQQYQKQLAEELKEKQII